MKRIVSLLICFAVIMAFVGCDRANTSSDTNGVDVEYYAKLGKMPESEYALSDDCEKVKSELTAKSEEDESFICSIDEGQQSVLINTGNFYYYYDKSKADKGISCIVALDTAYGFENGTISLEIKEALSKFTPEESENTDNLFFMNDMDNGSQLKYQFGKNTVIFVFQDNALCATVLYDSKNWNL